VDVALVQPLQVLRVEVREWQQSWDLANSSKEIVEVVLFLPWELKLECYFRCCG